MSITESRLREEYRNASDERLSFLAKQGSSEYTQTAWTLLTEEMSRRGLSPAPAAQRFETRQHRPAATAAVVLAADLGTELSAEEARAFVGPEADYYLARWARIREGRAPFLGFNWAACLFNLAWLIYRRMFRGFWITLAVLSGVSVLEALARRLLGWHAYGELTDAIQTVGTGIVFGMFGSYWYYLHARRQVRRLKANGPISLPVLEQRGGTDWNLALGAAIAVAALIIGAALVASSRF